MTQNNTTTTDVIDAVNNRLNVAEVEESDLVGGVRAVVPESEVGTMFGLLRRREIEFDSSRDPSGENLVFNIETEEPDTETLGELFG
jgi:hypothetical protein